MTTLRMEPVTAWRALQKLIADPEQTQEVFTIIRALSGPALQRGLKRFKSTPIGQTILKENRSLLSTLTDREMLSSLPAHSLGGHYLSFVTHENISAEGLVSASEEDGEFKYLDGDLALFGMRQRDMHDLWHTLTNYGRDTLGEVCLLAFTYAQTKNRGIGVICLAGIKQLRPTYGKEVARAAWQAYRDGKRAAWLPGQDWESLLAQPIDEVRAQLNIRQPEMYQNLQKSLQTAAA